MRNPIHGGRVVAEITQDERIAWYEARCVPTDPDDVDTCLIWSGSKTRDGHPRVCIDRRTHYVRRLIWEHHIGPIGPKHVILLGCDGGPACLQIEHMYKIGKVEGGRVTAERARSISSN